MLQRKQTKQNMLQSEKLVSLLVSHPRRFVRMLISKKYHAIKHQQGTGDLIEKVWMRCYLLFHVFMKSKKLRKKILFTLVFPLKNKWMIFLNKLNTLEIKEQDTLHIYLFQTLLQELISKEKGLIPFWNVAFKDLSEKLLLPIEIDCADLDSNLLNSSLNEVVVPSQCLTINKIKVQNKNSQKIYYQLSTSSVVDKWEKENMGDKIILKALKVQLKPTSRQLKILNEWINTSNYVYNKAVDQVNNHKHPVNFISLRDLLVTDKTKKNNYEYKELSKESKILNSKKYEDDIDDEKLKDLQNEIKNLNIHIRNVAKTLPYERNENLNSWELNTPKDIRAGAVNDLCDAFKTGMSNLKNGNISHFKLGFRKKKSPSQCLVIDKSSNIKLHSSSKKISFYTESFMDKNPDLIIKKCNCKSGKKVEYCLHTENIPICCSKCKSEDMINMKNKNSYFKIGKVNKKYKNLEINNDCRIIKKKNKFWIIIPVEEKINKEKKKINYCGTDMGIKTFATTFGSNGCIEYKHDYVKNKLDKLNSKIDILKGCRMNSRPRNYKNKRIRKRTLNKYENKKINIVNELHWKTINDMVKNNDFIMHGDIKSHDIVSHGKKYKYKRDLNRNFNDLKFYLFKQRLEYKAKLKNKKVFLVNEAYTTQTCSFCGNKYKPGVSRIYKCSNCKRNIGRDVNAAKNILMKGIILNL